jgi:hypothetical protein
MRQHNPAADMGEQGAPFELPPGATFEPDPQTSQVAAPRNDKHDI